VWVGGVLVRTLDWQLWLRVQFLAMTLPGYFWDRCQYFAGKLSWDITINHVNSALYPSGVYKSSISFSWGKGWKVTAAGLQVTLCHPIWHVFPVVVRLFQQTATSTLLYFLLHISWKQLHFRICDIHIPGQCASVYCGQVTFRFIL